MRIVFLATGDIAIPAFKQLIAREDSDVLALVTQPDRPFGRKQVLTPPAIKVVAEENGIPVFQPEKIKTDIEALAALDADYFIVMAYGQLLPQSIIDLPQQACLNLHGSLLPRHRGASPIQAAIMTGDAQTGVTVMHVVKALDAGDIVHPVATPIGEQETGGELHDRLADIAATAIDDAMDQFAAGTATRTPQDPDQVTYLGKLTRVDGLLDWTNTAEELESRIRAFDPWPGTTTTLKDGDHTIRLKIFPPTEIIEGDRAPTSPSKVTSDSDSLLITCGDGKALRITTLQPDGKRRMSAADFLRGHTLGTDATCS